ncbi:MAG: hyaluronoglucosaminidase [Actinomycetota bacterium]|jgi:hypothetical protein
MTDPDAGRLQDFVGKMPFAPPLPRRPPAGTLVPTPHRYDDRGESATGAAAVTIVGAPPGARRLLAEGLARVGVPVVDRGGWPVRVIADEAITGDEAYRLTARDDGMTVAASTATGLVRGACTARQLLRRNEAGAVVVRRAVIDDGPVVPLRMLAGWGLYRTHHLDWALEVAAEGKFNRVLYNWWTATADERMGDDEARLVAAARSMGVELVCELRRQALGPALSLDDADALEPLLQHYDDAVAHGFRSFGFLFDDTDHDPFDAELGLLRRIVDRLTARLGAEPEFFFCPRFYWFPGQMDYSWMRPAQGDDGEPSMAPMLGDGSTRSVVQATERQEDYQRRLAAVLPARTEVYLANWWSGTPDDWAPQLASGWTDRVGRQPVFWDNQQQNDFRAAVVHPLPLHQRPVPFAEALRGYTLNSGLPLSSFAPASITAGAWAWNPRDYDPATTMGTAIDRLYGAAGPVMTDAVARWSSVLDQLLQPRVGMEQHYRGLLLAVRAGEGGALDAALDDVDQLLGAASASLPEDAHPVAADGLDELRREVGRLRLDRALAACTERDEAERLVAAIAEILAARLPPVPELAAIVGGAAPGDQPVPGISWAIHFLFGPLGAGPRRLLGKVPPRADSAASP